MSYYLLSKRDTSVLKGIAICAMLLHHMYGCPVSDDIELYGGFLNWIGVLGKICVSIFLFCSGYGLSVQYGKVESFQGSLFFLRRRFIKFYANYWLIFAIFVPVTVLLFNRPLTIPYGEHVNLYKRVFLDLLGIQGRQSYNITWWFNQIIVVLWLLFPLIYCLTRKIGVIVSLTIGVLLLRFRSFIPGNFSDIYLWQFPFLLGIVWTKLAEDKRVMKVTERLNLNRYGFWIAVILVILFVFLRMRSTDSVWSGIQIDPFLTVSLALLVFFHPKKNNAFFQGLSFLGKHSMTIYLIHTFINGYWHPEWLHMSAWMRCGLNFVVLMSLCLAFSMILEWVKGRVRFYELVNRIIEA